MKRWLTAPDAAEKLGISVRALYYRMKKGQIETKIEDGNRLILIDVPETSGNVSSNVQEDLQETDETFLELLDEKDARIKQLERQVQQLEKQLGNQAEQSEKQVERQENHIERLEQLLALEQKNVSTLAEQNQHRLEDTRHKSSLWQRLKVKFAGA